MLALDLLGYFKGLWHTDSAKGRTVFDPTNPSFVQNPYPVYRRLREHDPIHRASSGVWVLTRHQDIVEALKDPRLSNAPASYAFVHQNNRERYIAADVANNIVAFLDPPEHDRPKLALITAFKKLLRGRQHVVEQAAEEALACLCASKYPDFVRAFAIPFAVTCTCRIMGYPDEEAERLKQWSSMFFHLFQPIPNAETLQRLNKSLAEFRECTNEIVKECRRRPRDGLITLLLQSERELEEQEIVDNVMLMAADGIENVWSGLSSAVATLLTHQAELKKMTKQPELVEAAVEECLRYEPPGQYQGRIALKDIHWGDKVIRKSSVVLLVFASANRDPKAFADPDCFNIERKDNSRHLAFGLGRHACIGGQLVRMEFSAALRKLFDGSRRIRLADKELTWAARPGHRWPVEVQLEIG